MPDLKITEMVELEDTQTDDGINDSDFLAVVDQSEANINNINKKVRVSTLHEFLAPINSPIFTGIPRSTTPPLNDNTTRIVTTEWVQNELDTLELNDLDDVTIVSTPENNQVLLYNTLSSSWEPNFPTTVNREVLSANKTLELGSAQYQFLDPNGAARDIILPTGATGLKFVIKTLDNSFDLNIKETGGGPIEATLNASNEIAEIVYDGVEWHIWLK